MMTSAQGVVQPLRIRSDDLGNSDNSPSIPPKSPKRFSNNRPTMDYEQSPVENIDGRAIDATFLPLRPRNPKRLSNHREILRNLDAEQVAPSSSEESGPDDVDDTTPTEFDERSTIGVSIGKRQSRLASPTTPAAERAAAFPVDEADYAVGAEDASFGNDGQHDGLSAKRPDHPSLSFAPVTRPTSRDALPSPWRSGPKYFEGLEASTASFFRNIGSIFSSSEPLHARKTSADTASPQAERDERRRGTIHLPGLRSRSRQRSTETRDAYDIVDAHAQSAKKDSGLNRFRRASIGPRSRSKSTAATPSPKPLMRRSTSDTMMLERSLSDTPSLGDDSRWENVTEMFNARARAVKDSLRDSNLKIPAVKNLTSFTLPSPLADFFHSHQEDGEHSHVAPPLRDRGSSLHLQSSALREKEALPPARPMTKTSAAAHPYFSEALKNLTGDVVIMGGYRGSILRSAKPPFRQQWIPIKVGLNLRRVDLEVGLEPEDEETEGERIIPSGMLKNIGPIDISRRLFKRLRASKHAQEGRLRVWDYGYDWRLSPHLLSRKLVDFLKELPCNAPGVPAHERGATVIAHSLGGLITRHAINQDPSLVSGVVYAGVPQHCVNILGPIRNGDDVLLSSRVLTAQTNFTIRTTFALLPLDGHCFFDRDTKEQYPVDFFNIKDWEENCFSPVISCPLPPLPTSSQSASNAGFLGSVVDTAMSILPSVVGGRRQSAAALASRRVSGSTPANPEQRESGTKTTAHPGDGANTTSSYTLDGATSGGGGGRGNAMAPTMDNKGPDLLGEHDPTTDSVSTHVTIPPAAARAYLIRVLAEVKKFKQELAHNPAHSYPPAAVIFGKSYPTVNGCRVAGREGIKRADAYEDLVFGSGDGVVLARAAMLPEGYEVCRGGVASSERGHLGLLGDLEGVGRCLNAVMAEKKRRRDEMEGKGKGQVEK